VEDDMHCEGLKLKILIAISEEIILKKEDIKMRPTSYTILAFSLKTMRYIP
jgi:hypothetical protein